MAADRPLHVAHGVLTLGVGGLERMTVALAKAGAARGQRVSVVCVEADGRLAADATAAGARVVALGKPPGRHRKYALAAAKLLDELRPDVLHTHQIGAAFYLAPAAAARRVPVLHTEHGNPFARVNWLAAAKARLFYKAAARPVRRFCCVSDEISHAVRRYWTVPARVIETVPNAIDTDTPPDASPGYEVRGSLGIPPLAPVVGTVGRLADVKRQDVLVRAAAALRPRFPDLRLLLVGDGPERTRLEKLADDLGTRDRVRFVGYQPHPERFYRAMDVFALTSRSEGFPVSLLEAWAAGVPVVASAVGGVPAVLSDGETGLLVRPGDVTGTADAIGKLLADRGSAGKLAANARVEVCRRYSLAKLAAGYEARYRELLG